MYSWVELQHLAKWCDVPEPPRASLPVPAIVTDSRQVKPGDCFVAYKGEAQDGYEYIPQAIENGAGAIIAEKPYETNVPVLLVKNGVSAIVAIATQLRRSFEGSAFAVTGSAGKSSTKEMIGTLLGRGVLCSPQSFNNLMGVSRTLFLVNDGSRQLVLEMGMNALGEIKELCEHFQPQGGLITNIGRAHIGMLGGEEKIYAAKKELFEGIAQSPKQIGIALNLDDAKVVKAFREAFPEEGIRTVTYTIAPDTIANVRVIESGMEADTGFLALKVAIDNHKLEFELPIFGLHHIQNIAAAIAATHLLGVSKENIQSRVKDIRPAPHRGEILNLNNEVTVIDESYNSNPEALNSSLASLGEMEPSRRRFIILGDMLELGDFSQKLHLEVGVKLAKLQKERKIPYVVLGVGKAVADLIKGIQRKDSDVTCEQVDDIEAAKPILEKWLQPRDIVFIKSSRGGQLDRLVEHLSFTH